MKWAIQHNIFLQTEYSSLRVPKSTWQVDAVYSFLFLSKTVDISGHIYTKVEKRTSCRFFISQIKETNGEPENEGYKIYYCR